MFVYFAGLNEGKLDKFDIESLKKAPFVKMSNGGIPEDSFKQYEDLVAYLEYLDELANGKLPDMIEEANKLPGKAETIKEQAKEEIEALDDTKKSQVTVKISSNIDELAKVPELFKSKSNQFKKQLEQAKSAVEEMQDKMKEYEEKGLQCHTDKKLKNAPEAYEQAYGPIKYTKEERAKWEKWASKVSKKNSKSFNPNSYHKNNQTE